MGFRCQYHSMIGLKGDGMCVWTRNINHDLFIYIYCFDPFTSALETFAVTLSVYLYHPIQFPESFSTSLGDVAKHNIIQVYST